MGKFQTVMQKKIMEIEEAKKPKMKAGVKKDWLVMILAKSMLMVADQAESNEGNKKFKLNQKIDRRVKEYISLCDNITKSFFNQYNTADLEKWHHSKLDSKIVPLLRRYYHMDEKLDLEILAIVLLQTNFQDRDVLDPAFNALKVNSMYQVDTSMILDSIEESRMYRVTLRSVARESINFIRG